MPSSHALSFYRRDDPVYQHLEFARWAELACQPFELDLNARRLRVAQKIAEQRHSRAQPA